MSSSKLKFPLDILLSCRDASIEKKTYIAHTVLNFMEYFIIIHVYIAHDHGIKLTHIITKHPLYLLLLLLCSKREDNSLIHVIAIIIVEYTTTMDLLSGVPLW